MGGRFGKYGDMKRKARLRRSKTEKYRMEKGKRYSMRRKKYKQAGCVRRKP